MVVLVLWEAGQVRRQPSPKATTSLSLTHAFTNTHSHTTHSTHNGASDPPPQQQPPDRQRKAEDGCGPQNLPLLLRPTLPYALPFLPLPPAHTTAHTYNGTHDPQPKQQPPGGAKDGCGPQLPAMHAVLKGPQNQQQPNRGRRACSGRWAGATVAGTSHAFHQEPKQRPVGFWIVGIIVLVSGCGCKTCGCPKSSPKQSSSSSASSRFLLLHYLLLVLLHVFLLVLLLLLPNRF